MKKLLDHFWRKRADASTPPESQPASPPPAKTARPIATISVAPRTVRPAWQAPTSSAPGKRLAPQTEHVDSAEIVTLTIGDIWDRLPSDLLSSNAPDRSTPMTFDLAGLSERIGRGEPAIPVTEIAQRIPQLFRANAVIAPDRMIMFPWKVMLNLINRSNDRTAAAGITPGGVEALSLKVRARRLHRPSKAAPATARPTPPPGVSPRPEEVQPPESGPIIPEKLTLQAPSSPPVPPSAPAQDHSGLPAPAPAPFLNQEHERQLAAIREERDAATAELKTLRMELVAINSQATVDRDALAALRAELAALQSQLAASAQTAETLRAERAAALARTAPPSASDPAAAQAAELLAARDAARAEAAKAIADGEAALHLAAEQSAEREAALLRLQELAAERDAALARAAELNTERERERSHTAAIGGEMAAAVSHAAECDQERAAANARAATLAAERDAALARVAALEAAAAQAPVADAAAASASAPAPATPEIESCRNTIQALYAERDALRQEQQQLTARLVVAGGIVEKEAVDAAVTNRPKTDAYGGLFPQRTSTSPLVIVLLMVLLAYGVFNVSKFDLSQAAGLVESPGATESEQVPAPVAAKVSATPLPAPALATTTILEEVIVTAPTAATEEKPSEEPTASVAEPTDTTAELDSQTGTDPAAPESTPLD